MFAILPKTSYFNINVALIITITYKYMIYLLSTDNSTHYLRLSYHYECHTSATTPLVPHYLRIY